MAQEKKRIPKWLEQTQYNSWEPEIFISGIVLYGLLQIPRYLEDFKYYFNREIFSLSQDIDIFMATLATGIQWMTFGLILHLFFRGIWIGLVGLSYVFPKGINHDRLNYSEKFKSKLTLIPDFTNQIIRLEKISSSIFSISYLIFMCIFGAYFFFLITILIPIYLVLLFTPLDLQSVIYDPVKAQILNSYGLIMAGMGLVYMIDFLTLGFFKKFEFLSKIYYPFYKLMSFLTFSSFYRHIYYILISNFKWWRVSSFIFAFIIITGFMISQNIRRDTLSQSLSRVDFFGNSSDNFQSADAYADMNPGSKFQRVTLQDDIIKDDVLRVFITHMVSFEDSIRVGCDYEKFEETSKVDSVKLACIGAFFEVKIDDSTYYQPRWRFHIDRSTGNRGVMGYFDISQLKRGEHQVDIDMRNWFFTTYAVVPFYKD